MSFPKHPIHIVFLKSLRESHLDSIVYKHCEEFHPSVRHMCMSIANFLRIGRTQAVYTTNEYGIKCARVTMTNLEIIIDCIDDCVKTPYVQFSEDNWERVAKENPGMSYNQLGEKIGEMWKAKF